MGRVELPDCCYEYREEQPKARIIEACMDCDSDIYEGDEYYDIQGMVICTECMAKYKISD
jgi:hypothetical protein